jgi:hypothetical protein
MRFHHSTIQTLFRGLVRSGMHRPVNQTRTAAPERQRRTGLARFEQLETRLALAINVTTLADSGDGSLRSAIEALNLAAKADSIVFSNLSTGTIALASALPTITNTAGTTFSFSGTNAITLDGGATSAADGLAFANGANGIVMNGLNLTLTGFDSGLRFLGNSTGSTINGLTLTANTNGIELVGGTMTGSVISGNTITANSSNGLLAAGGVTGLTIGGTTTAAQNLFAYNGDGLTFRSGSYTNTVVQGNSIIQNTSDGISFTATSGGITALQIGGATSSAANSIQSNSSNGVLVTQGDYTGTSIVGNLISGNSRHGIELAPAGRTLTNLAVGKSGQGNILQGNGADGLAAFGGTYTGTTIQGNAIQYNASNGLSINLQGGGGAFAGLLVGGPNLGNTIQGNEMDGVLLNSGVFSTTALQGNVIQTNGRHGVHFLATSGQKMTGFALGGTAVAEPNVIADNLGSGIAGSKADYTSTTIVGNTIRGNGIGINITDASNLTVGGLTTASKNTISGSKTIGLLATGTLTGTTFQGNALTGNPLGVSLLDAQGLSLGTATAGGGNTITGGTTGVRAVGNLSSSVISGNAITGQTTGIQMINATGASSATPFFVGGAATTVGNGAGNYVASTVHGLYAAGAMNNTTIAGNIFSASGLGGNAMVLENATGLTVGGSTAGFGNTLTAAQGNGLWAAGHSTGTGFYKNTLTASKTGAVLINATNFLFGVANNAALGNIVQYNQVGMQAMGICTGSGVCYTTWFRNTRKLVNTAKGLVVFPKV